MRAMGFLCSILICLAGFAGCGKVPALEDNWVAPYTVLKFRDALDRCKLQCPESTTAFDNGAELRSAATRYFHVADTDKMEFYQEGDHKRTELRDITEWKTSTSNERRITARLNIQYVSPMLGEVTVLQVHDSSITSSKPLLRIAWVKYRDGVSNTVWAILRTNVTLEAYSYTALGAPEDQFFNVAVSVITNDLEITYNGSIKLDGVDLNYWEDFDNYFKAGAYLQTDGFAYIRFDELDLQ